MGGLNDEFSIDLLKAAHKVLLNLMIRLLGRCEVSLLTNNSVIHYHFFTIITNLILRLLK